MIRLPSYLHQHPSGIYYFRIAIPQALKAVLKQREWKKSLRTRDPEQAKRSARVLALQVDYLLRKLEGDCMAKKPIGFYLVSTDV